MPENVAFAEGEGPRVGGAGHVRVLHDDGVLQLPEHEPAAVQGVRPDGSDQRAHGLGLRERDGGAARGGADQRVEGAGPAAGAHRADAVRGHVERPARPAPAAAHTAADLRAGGRGRSVRVLRAPVVGVAGGHGCGAGVVRGVHGRRADAVQRRQLVRGGHHAGRMADRQVRRAGRHHRRRWHTRHARLRVRGGQRGFRGRVPGVRVPRSDGRRASVRFRRRFRRRRRFSVRHRPVAHAGVRGRLVRRQNAAVRGRRAHRQPDGRVPQLSPRAHQTPARPRHHRPLSRPVGVRAAHVRAAGR